MAPIHFGRDADWNPNEDLLSTTQFLRDNHTILTRQDNPDVGFEVGVNPYRDCEQVCIYCQARWPS